MRWDNLRIENQDEHQLPGYRDPAVVRRFDAPEALNIRFYEVHAKSALNQVPKASRMPFRWTINAYRGCSHACTYCFARPTHEYLGFNTGEDFERRIVVKVNAVECPNHRRVAVPRELVLVVCLDSQVVPAHEHMFAYAEDECRAG